MEEAELLELLCAGKRPDVERSEAALGDELRELSLGFLVVAGDQYVELLTVDLAGDERAGKGGIEGLHDGRPARDELCDLLRGRTSGLCGQPVPRLCIDRVGDVDDDLAIEAVGVLLHGILDARVVEGEDDDLAAEAGVRLSPVAESPSSSASWRAFAGSRSTISTSLPPAIARVAMPRPMLPAPMIVTLT
jgi:hypothetical protein